MSLTESEVAYLKSSWADISKLGMQEVGLTILHRLFETVPGSKIYFYKSLSPDVPTTVENLRANPTIRQHATRIGTSISKIVKNLDDQEKFDAAVDYIGQVHVRHKVNPEYFEKMAPVLLHVIGKIVTEPMDSRIMILWARAYEEIKRGIVKAMSEKP